MQTLIIAGNVALPDLLRCDFETGELFWFRRSEDILVQAGLKRLARNLATWNARYADMPAFTSLDGYGYLMGRIFSKPYKAHRIVWALRYGRWPESQIDHLNGVRTDNRIANLRSVSQSENNKNMRARSDNKSGHVGVCFDSTRQKWLATINTRYIGRFDTKREAIEARRNHPQSTQFTERHGL